MNNGFRKLKQAWEENPVGMILLGAVSAASAAKLIDALSNASSRHTYAREVQRRERKDRGR